MADYRGPFVGDLSIDEERTTDEEGKFQPRPRIVRKQVEEAADLCNLDVGEDELIRFLRVFDLIQQRDVAIGYDDQPILPWSVQVKIDKAERLKRMYPRDVSGPE